MKDTHASFVATGISKSFGNTRVVNDVSLKVFKGEVVSVVGPSGSGKSTFLRCLNLLERPDAGSIRTADIAFEFTGSGDKVRRKDLLALRRRVGMVFQSFNLFPHVTIHRNISFPMEMVFQISRDEAEQKAYNLLKQFGLEKISNNHPNECSGGQQQRVAIARTLGLEPQIILFDEPTSALDAEVGAEILEIMTGLAKTGSTMVVVTHELSFAREVSERMLLFADGKVVEDGPPKSVMDTPSTKRAQLFFDAVLRH